MSDVSAVLTRGANLLGRNFSQQKSVTGDVGLLVEYEVPRANPGTLSTRTDNDTGTITVTGTNTITTGDRVDVYWSGGVRYGMTAGTVSGQAVPIDLGAGDNLPVSTTVVQVCKAVSMPCAFTAAKVVAFAAFTESAGQFTLTQTGGTVVWHISMVAGGVFTYESTDGTTTPFGADVGHAYFSHNDTDAAQTMRIAVLLTA